MINFIKLCINKRIINTNGKVRHVNKAIQPLELENSNKITTCRDNDKQTSSAYDIKYKEKTLVISEKKKRHGMVILEYINVVNNSALQPFNAYVKHRK